jgi:hypothetical protein
MLFWEVLSGFRDHPIAVRTVLSSEPWREAYWERFIQFNQLVAGQDRAKLDQQVPLAGC